MANFEIPESPEFSTTLRRLEKSDPGDAELFNGMYARLLENEVSLKNEQKKCIPKTGGKLTGTVTATATDLTVSQIRNVAAGTSAVEDVIDNLSVGDIYFRFEEG